MNANSPEKKLLDEIREAYAKTYPNCIFTLVNRIDILKEELEQKDLRLREFEEREAACCPEDFGFDEVISIQQNELDKKDAKIAELGKAAENE